MANLRVSYRGVTMYPVAAYDGGQYAAMLIREDFDGSQRATGVIDYYPTPDAAYQAAIDLGIQLVNAESAAHRA